jgi:uncharacterized membrane protein YgaE (UPF0421/DUF939 family)
LLARSAFGRISGAWQAVALAACGAAIAWFLAHRVLGHSDPFFAPIAAAVALSSSSIQRGRRAVQLVGGVLLGIAIAEALSSLLGTGTLVLGAIVLLTMSAAVMVGAGFVGQGMMFVNQAAGSAVLVVVLHKHGTGPERALDALVGGAVAIVLGVLLFPVEPLGVLARAERAVLSALSTTLAETASRLSRGAEPEPGWAVQTGHRVHRLLADLAAARSTARAAVRIAPRRWRQRAAVDAEVERTAYVDLLANTVLSLERAATRAPLGDGAQRLAGELGTVGELIGTLAETGPPWSAPVQAHVIGDAMAVVERTGDLASQRAGVVAAVLTAVAEDLRLVAGVDPAD